MSQHSDPQKSKPGLPIKGHLMCQYCHAVYQGKHWAPLSEMDPKLVDEFNKGCCPACRLEKNHLCDGILHLSGSPLAEHHDDLLGNINNVAQRAYEADNMNRLQSIEDGEEDGVPTMTIYTTKHSLAVDMGKAIDSAFKGGKLTINYGNDEKTAEVIWHKE